MEASIFAALLTQRAANLLFKINVGGILAYLFGEMGILVLAPLLGGAIWYSARRRTHEQSQWAEAAFHAQADWDVILYAVVFGEKLGDE